MPNINKESVFVDGCGLVPISACRTRVLMVSADRLEIGKPHPTKEEHRVPVSL